MHLILDPGQQLKGSLPAVHGDLAATVGNGTGSVLIVLHHAVYGYMNPQLPQHWCHGVHLPLASVQQDQIRQPGKAFIRCSLVFPEPTLQHLVHAGIIVLDLAFPD